MFGLDLIKHVLWDTERETEHANNVNHKVDFHSDREKSNIRIWVEHSLGLEVSETVDVIKALGLE